MNSIVLWIISLIIYLLIGWGTYVTFYSEDNVLVVFAYSVFNRRYRFITFVFWPFELGVVIGQASEKVVEGIRGCSPPLEAFYDEVLRDGRKNLK